MLVCYCPRPVGLGPVGLGQPSLDTCGSRSRLGTWAGAGLGGRGPGTRRLSCASFGIHTVASSGRVPLPGLGSPVAGTAKPSCGSVLEAAAWGPAPGGLVGPPLLMVSLDRLLVSIGKEKVIVAEGPVAPGFGRPLAPICPFLALSWAQLLWNGASIPSKQTPAPLLSGIHT